MTFAEKFSVIMEKIDKKTRRYFWLRATLFSLLVLAIFILYEYLNQFIENPHRDPRHMILFNKGLANGGMFLIGISFALSGLCYFFDFVDTKIIYRKHLGILGYFATVAHVIISIWGLPWIQSITDYFKPGRLWPFIYAVIALLIFTMMALISNKYATTTIGSKNWRRLLRTGYIAYLFALAHLMARSASDWREWWAEPTGSLIPASFYSAILVIAVTVFRLVLEISERRAKPAAAQPQSEAVSAAPANPVVAGEQIAQEVQMEAKQEGETTDNSEKSFTETSQNPQKTTPVDQNQPNSDI